MRENLKYEAKIVDRKNQRFLVSLLNCEDHQPVSDDLLFLKLDEHFLQVGDRIVIIQQNGNPIFVEKY